MTKAEIHRTINSVAIGFVAIVIFTMLERLIIMLEHEYTLPQCEVMLYEKIYEREAPIVKD